MIFMIMTKHRNDSWTPIKLKLATKILTSLSCCGKRRNGFPLEAVSLLFLQHKIDFRVTGERVGQKLDILMPGYDTESRKCLWFRTGLF